MVGGRKFRKRQKSKLKLIFLVSLIILIQLTKLVLGRAEDVQTGAGAGAATVGAAALAVSLILTLLTATPVFLGIGPLGWLIIGVLLVALGVALLLSGTGACGDSACGDSSPKTVNTDGVAEGDEDDTNNQPSLQELLDLRRTSLFNFTKEFCLGKSASINATFKKTEFRTHLRYEYTPDIRACTVDVRYDIVLEGPEGKDPVESNQVVRSGNVRSYTEEIIPEPKFKVYTHGCLETNVFEQRFCFPVLDS